MSTQRFAVINPWLPNDCVYFDTAEEVWGYLSTRYGMFEVMDLQTQKSTIVEAVSAIHF